MAQFPNNNFQRDTNADHTIRCEFFVSGAATHGVELAFRGTLVADITTHLDNWKALELQHEDEKGDVEAATGLINTLKTELEALIVQGRYFVNSVLSEVEAEGVDEHDIRRDFGVEGKIPDGVAKLVDLGRQMAAINAKYILESSPYALPAAPFEEIGTVAEALSDALDARKVEHREQMHVGKLKEVERKVGDRLLSRAFNWACAVWGYDEPKLEDLGFVPKSQIWTPGQPEPGVTDWPNAPVAKIWIAPYPVTGILAGCEEYTGTDRFDFRIAYAKKNEPVPEMPADNYLTDVEGPALLGNEFPLEKNMVYYEWIRASKDSEVSEWSDVASVEWTEESITK